MSSILEKVPFIGKFLKAIRILSVSNKVIHESKGDFGSYKEGASMSSTIKALNNISASNSSGLEPIIGTVRLAEQNLNKHKAIFKDAYKNNTLGKEIYLTAVLNLELVVTLLVARCITVTNTSQTGIRLAVNREGVAYLRGHKSYENLKKFNEYCGVKSFKQIVQLDAEGSEVKLTESLSLVAIGSITIAAIIGILYIARDVLEYFYAIRNTVAKWADTRAAFLKMNAAALDSGTPKSKQLEYAKIFEQLADKIRVDDIIASDNAERAVKSAEEEVYRDNPAAQGKPMLTNASPSTFL